MGKYAVNILRWDQYRVTNLEADSLEHAEEKAVEIYQDTLDCEHVDGGLVHVSGEEVEP